MISRAWAATTGGGASWLTSLVVATDVLQFITAVLGLVSVCYGLYLFRKKHKAGE